MVQTSMLRLAIVLIDSLGILLQVPAGSTARMRQHTQTLQISMRLSASAQAPTVGTTNKRSAGTTAVTLLIPTTRTSTGQTATATAGSSGTTALEHAGATARTRQRGATERITTPLSVTAYRRTTGIQVKSATSTAPASRTPTKSTSTRLSVSATTNTPGIRLLSSATSIARVLPIQQRITPMQNRVSARPDSIGILKLISVGSTVQTSRTQMPLISMQ